MPKVPKIAMKCNKKATKVPYSATNSHTRPKNYNKGEKLKHSSLSRQNNVNFGTDLARARNKFTRALLAHLYVFSIYDCVC